MMSNPPAPETKTGVRSPRQAGIPTFHPVLRADSVWRQRLPRLAIVCFLAILVCGFLDIRNPISRAVGPLDYFEQYAYNVRMALYGSQHPHLIEAAQRKIVLVTLNDDTFRKLPGPPVPRNYHAKVVRDLTKAGAKVIAFDLLFKTHSLDAADDEAFAAAAKASQRVLWASLFNEIDGRQVLSPPIDPLLEASTWQGHINSGTFSAEHPVVDRVSAVIPDGKRLVPSFSLMASRMATETTSPLQRTAHAWQSGDLKIPVDKAGDFRVTFLGGPGEVFAEIPYEQIYQGAVNDEFYREHQYFKDKIVVIGDNTKVGNDRRVTPLGEMNGVEIHAHAIATILSNDYIREAPPLANLAAIAFMGAIVCLLAAARRLQTIVLELAVVCLAFFIFNVWLFVAHGWWLHFVAPVAALGLATIGMLIEGGMYQEREKERMFDAFVTASVSAIESRDPATAGHSQRVTSLSVALAEAVSETQDGPLKRIRFSPAQLKELRYAGLLHDFGKIGVRESVLIKSHKLHPLHFEAINSRLLTLRNAMLLECAEQKLKVLLMGLDETSALQFEQEVRQRLEHLDRDIRFLQHCNDPLITVIEESKHLELQEVLSRLEDLHYTDSNGVPQPVITAEERHALSIRKGSLTPEEYREIQQHSQLSYDFLRQIPWTDNLSFVPDIAYSHHEKMNGRGYPRGLKATDIPLQARIMTIADIFDALTAADRPYKKAISIEKALQILSEEAASGALDADLLQIFIAEKVYEKVDGMSDRQSANQAMPQSALTSAQPST